jgi:hypothetical protein
VRLGLEEANTPSESGPRLEFRRNLNMVFGQPEGEGEVAVGQLEGKVEVGPEVGPSPVVCTTGGGRDAAGGSQPFQNKDYAPQAMMAFCPCINHMIWSSPGRTGTTQRTT